MVNKSSRVLPMALVLMACGGGAAAAPGAKTDAPPAKDSTAAVAAAAAAKAPRARRAPFDTAAAAGKRPLSRETYHYQGTVRDPFKAEVTVTQAGPELADLKLVSIIYNPTDPDKSSAQFRELGSDRRYVWHPGDHSGRISVVSMSQTDVTLREDDFGVERRQNYTLRKPEDTKP